MSDPDLFQPEALIIENQFISFPSPPTEKYFIRDGHLWLVLTDQHLAYVNISQKSSPNVTTFPQFGNVLLLSVSPCGKFCFIRTNLANYIIEADNFKTQTFQRNDTTTFTAATWLPGRDGQKPILCVGNDRGGVFFHNLQDSLPAFQCFAESVLQKSPPISALSLTYLRDHNFALAVAQTQRIRPYILDKQFLNKDSRANKETQTLPILTDFGSTFSETNYIALQVEGGMIFTFIIDFGGDNIQRLLSRQAIHNAGKKVDRIVLNRNFLYTFSEKTITIHVTNNDNAWTLVGKIQTKGTTFDYDPHRNEFITIVGKSVHRIRFNFDIWYAVYQKHLSSGNKKGAKEALYHSILPPKVIMTKFATNPGAQFHLFSNYLELISPAKKKQQTAIALIALDFGINWLISSKKDKKAALFEWIRDKLNRKILTAKVVRETFETYGLFEIADDVINSADQLDTFLAIGDYSKAIKCLQYVSDDDKFAEGALRIFSHDPQGVAQLISKRQRIDISKLSPLLISPICANFVLTLQSNNTKLISEWLREIFSYHVASSNDEIRVCSLCTDVHFSAQNKDFALRCLRSNGEFLKVATCLKALHDYVGAASAAAKVDVKAAFELIPGDAAPDIRRRCANRIMRSLNRSDSGEVAKEMLSTLTGTNIDTATILHFLPDDTPVAELIHTIEENVNANKEKTLKQEAIMNDAMASIERTSKLLEKKHDVAASFSSVMECMSCHKSLLTEAGVMFPCGHGYHKDCANKICSEFSKRVGIDNVPINLDCPRCGFMAAMLVTENLGIDEGDDNSWEIGPSQ